MKTLITGGCGFVGRYFTKLFLEKGHLVDCVDPLVIGTGAIHPSKWPMFNVEKDINFYNEDCRTFIKKIPAKQYDYIIHLAAIVGGRLTIENDPLAVATDLSIDSEMIAWASLSDTSLFVYFSSSAAYPISSQQMNNFHLLKENEIDFSTEYFGKPDLTYGWSKLTGEFLLSLATKKRNMRTVVYRPFSGYGEDQDLTYPFPAICKRVLEHKDNEDFIVWGSGLQKRDFVHIEDCVKCVDKTMCNEGQVFNISSGQYTSFIEFSKLCLKLENKHAEVKGMSNMPEGVFARGGDRAKQEKHGFYPKISLQEGIELSLNYWRGK